MVHHTPEWCLRQAYLMEFEANRESDAALKSVWQGKARALRDRAEMLLREKKSDD